jgi:hypothetical protein
LNFLKKYGKIKASPLFTLTGKNKIEKKIEATKEEMLK